MKNSVMNSSKLFAKRNVLRGGSSLWRRCFRTCGASYEEMHRQSISDSEKFWLNYAKEKIDWVKEPSVALKTATSFSNLDTSSSLPPLFNKWFPDGEINMFHT